MVAVERFNTLPTLRQPELQPDSPVYVHCSRRCEDSRSGAVFLQVRLINRTDRGIKTVVLRVEGLNGFGVTVYTTDELILADCAAKPHSVFGENKILAIDRTPVSRVRISVERVVFDNGIQWNRLPDRGLVNEEDAGWITCTCGMRNPPGESCCALCRKHLKKEIQPPPKEPPAQDEPAAPVKEISPSPEPYFDSAWAEPPYEEPRPAPVVRTFYEEGETAEWEEEPWEAPGWLVVLLCILGVVALLAVVAFLAYCFMQYTGKI